MGRMMKDSGVEYIGQLPALWELKKLKFLVSYNTEALGEDTPENYIFDYIDIGSVENGKGITAMQRMLFSAAPSRARRIVKKDDVTVSTVRTYLKAVASIDDFDIPQIVSTGFVVLRTKEAGSITAEFLKYSVLSESFISEVASQSVGISYPAINSSDVVEIKIPVPPISEQQIITIFLDEQCTKIDSIIEKTRSSIEEYKHLKQAVITQAVTKGVRGDRPMKESGIEWIGEIPEEWTVAPHKFVMHKEKNICENYDNEPILSLTLNGVVIRDLSAGGKMPTTFDGYQYVKSGDLLLCLFDIDVTPRCVGVVKDNGITSPAYSRFIVHSGFLTFYYDYLLRSIDDRKIFVHLSKNLRNSLTESDFGAIKTIVPSMEEQWEIATYLDKKCAEIDALIAQKEQLLTELENYKKSLIYEYVTGKKEVPHEH